MSVVASQISFYQFSSLLEKLSKLNREDKRKKLLKAFIKKWREFGLKLHSDGSGDNNDSFFPAMRLLVPQLDRDREAYGIKQYTLAKLFIEVFGLGKTSSSAQNLMNYKTPKVSKNDITGSDFATVAYFVLKDRCPEKGTLTLAEVNAELDSIATGYVTKNQEKVRKSLLHLMKNASSKELKWLVRVILKEVKFGIGQKSMFHCFHSDAEELYNVKMSLEKVCLALKDPIIRLHEIEISMFTCFRPMLAQRQSPDNLENIMKKKPYFVEVKFDGERMQLHMENGKFKYFSRGGNEYTHVYGEDRHQGNLTPHIARQFDMSVCSCILDGEMVGYNPVDDTIGSKGENFDVKSLHLDTYQPMFVAFDALLVNKKVLTNLPLRKRKDVLIKIFKPLSGRFIMSKVDEKITNQDCIDALNEAIDKREEGIMIKDPESIYKPNCRERGGWFKMKPDYIGGISDDLDILIVGGFFGSGSNMVTHFLCAVAMDTEPGKQPEEFYTFCKVGTGYTIKELTELNMKLCNDWLPFDKTHPPDWLKFPPSFKQKPDVVVNDPKNSFIFQVKAAEIIDSDQYKTNMTLRFPRVEKIRCDKPWYDCLTVKQLDQLRQKFDGKLAGRHVTSGDLKGKEGTKKRTSKVRAKPTVDKRFRGINAGDVTKTSSLLDGREVCVMTGDDNNSKSQIEEIIVKHGGEIVQNPGDETYCTLAGKKSLKVNNIIKLGNRNVIKIDWLLRCVQCQQLLPWTPPDMVYANPKTESLFSNNYDCHGDSYYDDCDEAHLKILFENIKVPLENLLNKEQIADTEIKYFPLQTPFGLFCLLKAHIYPSCNLSLSSVQFRIHGGTTESQINNDTTHVIVPNNLSDDDDKIKELKMMNRKRGDERFKIVYEQWVVDSIDNRKRQSERSYQP